MIRVGTPQTSPGVRGDGRTDLAALLVAVGPRTCALPLEHVLETMRPQLVAPLAGSPACVLGVAVIRGVPTPVVDLRRLFGDPGDTSPARFVTVKTGERPAAIAVDAVVGVANLDAEQLGELPPLLDGPAKTFVDAIGTRDARLLVVLRSARLVPTDVWTALSGAARRP